MAQDSKLILSDMVAKNTEVRDIIEVFKSSGLSKLKISVAGNEVEMELPVAGAVQQFTTAAAGANTLNDTTTVESGTKVVSPLVGTFYGAAGPGKPRFVEVGKQVKKGDILCIIEAMKVMNEIKAPVSGRIASINVDEAQMVEYDQLLFVIE